MVNKPAGFQDPALLRREFLRRLGRTVGLSAVLGSGAWYWHDAAGPQEFHSQSTTALETTLGDYQVDGTQGRLAVVRGGVRQTAMRAAMDALGGPETYIAPGDRVLIKVNAAFAASPDIGATTHPDLVGTLVDICHHAGGADVVVTDNPIHDPAGAFRLTGIQRAVVDAGGRIILPGEQLFTPLTLPGGRLIRNWPVLHQPFDKISKVIGVAPVKDHHRSGASLTLKNWYGLLGGRRNVFHQDINGIITELGRLLRPTLVVLDGTVAMMTNGPTGGSLADLKATETLIAGTDPVAVDTCGAELLGRRPADLPYLGQAAAAGLGTVDYPSLNPVEVNAG